MLNPLGKNQQVLVIFCYPQDKTAMTNSEITTQKAVFENLVNPGVSQMSFERTDFAFDYTDSSFSLPLEDAGYFDRDGDAAKMLDHNRLAADALNAAAIAGKNINNYAGYIICLATKHLRSWAFKMPSGMYWTNDLFPGPVWLFEDKQAVVISHNAHWGRRIHELSHGMGVGDYYGKTGIISDGKNWDMGGKHNRMPLYSGYQLDRMKWYKPENIKTLKWDNTEYDETFIIRAHDITENTNPDRYHLVKIKIFKGLTYYIEVRQEPPAIPEAMQSTDDDLTKIEAAADFMANNPDQILFDTNVPGADSAPLGGVVVTKMADKNTKQTLNQRIRTITLLSEGLMDVGDEAVDAARGLNITVEELTSERPLAYRVRVKWSVKADPNGLFNLNMRPWDSSWQTPDIWVDSEANGWDAYEDPLDAEFGDPIGNGDRPWVNKENRIYARIHNDGAEDAQDVQVTFYANSPPAIGDRGTWVPLATKTISSIAQGSSKKVNCNNWTPKKGKHTCLKVAVETQTGETTFGDNSAQENVFKFDTASGSPHKPIVQTVSVQNPLPKPVIIHILGSGLPVGWEATVEHSWLHLPAFGEKQMRVALFTDMGRERPLAQYEKKEDTRLDIPQEIRFLLSGAVFRWLGEGPNKDDLAEHLRPIGGIQIAARARLGISIDIDVDAKKISQGRLQIYGSLKPRKAGIRITLAIEDGAGAQTVTQLTSDSEGKFYHNVQLQNRVDFEPPYQVQAFIIADAVAADCTSDIFVIESWQDWYILPDD